MKKKGIVKKGKETYIRGKRVNTYTRQAVMRRYRKQVEELTEKEIDEMFGKTKSL